MLTRALLRGLLSYVPGFDPLIGRRRIGGGTSSARYCYSVWLRHLTLAHAGGLTTIPATIAELGPGDSVGLGMAALLSGVERYWALDVVSYSNPARNLRVFDDLVDLFTRRAPIPNDPELAQVKPALDSYAFPAHILTDERLRAALDPKRLAYLRNAVSTLGSAASDSDPLRYMTSWQDAAGIRMNSVDALYSQAVLEHVDDLELTYRAMRDWLRPGAYMSHQIDFRCHGTTSAWNGHWGVSDWAWRVAQGRREYFLNRQPCSRHLSLLEDFGFVVVSKIPQIDNSGIARAALAPRFQTLTDEDLRTSGLFVQAVRGNTT